jgi:hypothetical protein
MSPKQQPVEQFTYRVRKTVDCHVTVEAATQEEADKKVLDSGNWIDEQDDGVADWEVRGVS